MSDTLDCRKSVSVLIPCFNGEETIRRSILSAAHGTVSPDEIIVYDDGSTDNSLGIALELKRSVPILSVIAGIDNKGAGYARNVLLKAASGDYFAFLDADDWWYPRKLQTQLEEIEKHNLDIVTCHYPIYNEDLRVIGTRKSVSKINWLSMHFTNWLATSMTIVRADLVGAKEMPDIRRRQDYAYWLRIFASNRGLRCGVIQDPLGGYLKRSSSLSSKKLKNLTANYHMFRSVMNYGVVLSATCVFLNSLIRFIR